MTLTNQRDDDWPISKYQEIPAANQPLPTPCLCSFKYCCKSGRGALLKTPLRWMRQEPWLKLAIKPLYAFALLWTSYSLSFGDSDSGHNTTTRGWGRNIRHCYLPTVVATTIRPWSLGRPAVLSLKTLKMILCVYLPNGHRHIVAR